MWAVCTSGQFRRTCCRAAAVGRLVAGPGWGRSGRWVLLPPLHSPLCHNEVWSPCLSVHHQHHVLLDSDLDFHGEQLSSYSRLARVILVPRVVWRGWAGPRAAFEAFLVLPLGGQRAAFAVMVQGGAVLAGGAEVLGKVQCPLGVGGNEPVARAGNSRAGGGREAAGALLLVYSISLFQARKLGQNRTGLSGSP